MIVINDTEEEKMYAAFKVQQHYMHIEHINSLFQQLTIEMLINGTLQIKDLPFEIRISNKTYYVAAFRYGLYMPKEKFLQDVKLLYDDLQKDFDDKKSFVKLLLSRLDFCDFQGDEQIENYKKYAIEMLSKKE